MRKLKKILFTLLMVVMVSTLQCCSGTDDMIGAKDVFGGVDNVNTGLPKVCITTPGKKDITNKDTWMEGVSMVIYNTDGSVSYQGTLSIKGRGNTTWGYPKKPYALKLDKKAEILGMPKHKRWCLLANWMDRTMMRNAVAFETARLMDGLAWTPKGTFVELFVNGRHQGNYYLTEQIKVDANRVDIAELDGNATSGVKITGGYIFEIDSHFDEPFKFTSSRRNLPWQFKDPDEVNEAQFQYVKDLVSDMEDALYNDIRFANRDFERYMDLTSFVDWWLVHELTMNAEPVNGPNSCYVHKDIDRNGKLSKFKAGPVWDFDFRTFMPIFSKQYTIKTALYYDRLFQDREFVRLVKERWKMHKANGLRWKICTFIDRTEQLLIESDKINAHMWPISYQKNNDTYMAFPDAVKRLKVSFTNKFDWLDNAISKL